MLRVCMHVRMRLYMAVCHLYSEYIGMCRDAYFLQRTLTIISKTHVFLHGSRRSCFKHGFWLLFLRFPYVLSWGRLLQGSL